MKSPTSSRSSCAAREFSPRRSTPTSQPANSAITSRFHANKNGPEPRCNAAGAKNTRKEAQLMSKNHVSTGLPDEVYGAADCNVSNPRRLKVNITDTASITKSAAGSTTKSAAGSLLIHAHIGGIYLAMTERNWRALFNAISSLEIEVKQPTRTIKITMDDANAEAHVEVTA